MTRLAFLPLIVLCFNVFAAPSLSDREAKSIIEKDWLTRKFGWEEVKLGALNIVKDDPGVQEITRETYRKYEIWERVGVISISVTKEGRGNTSAVGSKTPSGPKSEGIDQITVGVTNLGSRYFDPENQAKLKILWVDSGLPDFVILNNNVRRKGSAEFRLIYLKFKARPHPLWKKFNEINETPLPEIFEAITLLKWDSSSGTWSKVAWDVTKQGDAFKTRRVLEMLD